MIKKNPLALSLKGSSLYVVRMVMHTADLLQIKIALEDRIHDMNCFRANESIVIDARSVRERINWQALAEILRKNNLSVVGAAVSDIEDKKNVQTAGFRSVELPLNYKSQQSILNSQNSISSLVVKKPLRSGQKIYAHRADLIVIGMVSQGAEIIADGNIHVYGPLRGKAMAGANGNKSMRIFTTQLDAELLSVAGIYHLLEKKPSKALHNNPALIELRDNTLFIQAL